MDSFRHALCGRLLLLAAATALQAGEAPDDPRRPPLVSAGRQQMVVQLAGIDAPELTQEFGKEARDFLAEAAVKKTVVVEVLERKPNKSIVARLTIDGEDLAQVLVEEGLAWASDDPSPAPLKAAEERAQAAGDGLWSTSNPTPPWQYRKAA